MDICLRILALSILSLLPVSVFAQSDGVDPVLTQIAASSHSPFGPSLDQAHVCVTDRHGNVYVAGELSNNVLRVSPSGTITEIIGPDGDGAGHQLSQPMGLAVAPDGAVYVSGYGSNNVFRIKRRRVTQVLDASDGLDQPRSMVVSPDGTLFVAGMGSSNVLRVATDGSITEVLGPEGDGYGNTVHRVGDLALDRWGILYAAGYASHNAFKIWAGGDVREIIDTTGDGMGHTLEVTGGIAVDDNGNVFVSGFRTNNVFHIDAGGNITELLDESGTGEGQELRMPRSMVVDYRGDLLVTGGGSHNVFKLSPEYGAVCVAELGDAIVGEMIVPYGMALGPNDDLYVSCYYSDNLFRLDGVAVSNPWKDYGPDDFVVSPENEGLFGDVVSASAASLPYPEDGAGGWVKLYLDDILLETVSNTDQVIAARLPDVAMTGVLRAVSSGGESVTLDPDYEVLNRPFDHFDADVVGFSTINSYLLALVSKRVYVLAGEDFEAYAKRLASVFKANGIDGEVTPFDEGGFFEGAAMSDTQGVILENDDYLIVAFSGTQGEQNPIDYATDIALVPVPIQDGSSDSITAYAIGVGEGDITVPLPGLVPYVHLGFMVAANTTVMVPSVGVDLLDDSPGAVFDSTSVELFDMIADRALAAQALGKTIWLTGHSLGGAVANITAHQLTHETGVELQGLVTFGAPAVGNWFPVITFPFVSDSFVASLDDELDNRHQRIVVEGDPIPLALAGPTSVYAHAGVVRTIHSSGEDEGEFFPTTDEVTYPYTISGVFDEHVRYWEYLTNVWINSPESQALGVAEWPHIDQTLD